jgi:pentatricopeptide repeat protein
VPYSMVADVHVALGDFDAALHWFGEACRARCPLLTLAVARPANRVIWGDERFRFLVREMGLESLAKRAALCGG